MLQKRMRIVCILATLAPVFFALFRLSTPEQWNYFRSIPAGRALLVYESAFAALNLGLALWLGAKPNWPMSRLRAVEYVVVGLFTVYVGWSQWVAWAGTRIPSRADGTYDAYVLRQFVDSMAIRWVALIVGLATLIPETGRRTAALVGSLVAASMTLIAVMAFTDPVYSQQPVKTIALMGFWMVIAGALGIFGSYKLAELREQVREALELGQYRLKHPLGAGGMGEVYLAEHRLMKQECAIKLIRPERAGDSEALRRFELEVQATSRLTHWNTVRIFDYGHAEDGTFYYVMEYLPGRTLEQIVAEHGPLPPERAIHFLRQICAALIEAHGMGLIHRDIKPANVIACTRGGIHDHAKLLDFGLVRDSAAESGITLEGDVNGTPAYMSPEQIRATGSLGPSTDLYSLGAVGYFLVTGQPPFVRASMVETLMAHAMDSPVPASTLRADLPADLDAVLMRCLEKKIADRYASVADLDAALAACRAAGRWDEERAAAWWRERAG